MANIKPAASTASNAYKACFRMVTVFFALITYSVSLPSSASYPQTAL